MFVSTPNPMNQNAAGIYNKKTQKSHPKTKLIVIPISKTELSLCLLNSHNVFFTKFCKSKTICSILPNTNAETNRAAQAHVFK